MAARVLIVDDDREMVELIQLFLANAGYETLTATSGEAALETAFREKPDLILLDIMMPKIDGWEVFRSIKNDPQAKAIPIAFITARTQNIDKMIGLSVMKADGYITKPFSKKDLLEKVAQILRAREDSQDREP